MLAWNHNFNGFYLKSTLLKVARCKRPIFCWILSEIRVFLVTCWRGRFFCMRNISKMKQPSARKHTEHCLTDLNKTACEIWNVSDKVHFWVKYLTLFFHQSLHLFLYRMVKCPTEAEKIEYTKMSYLIIDFEGQNETMYNRINFHSLSSLYYKS